MTNYSNSTVTNLRLNTKFPAVNNSWWCEDLQWYSKNFNNLDLQPGETQELKWYGLEVLSNNDPTGTELEMCFWTSRPDGRLDGDHLNDLACEDFVVGTDDMDLEFSFQISPNPATAFPVLRYSFPNDPSTAEVQVFNTIGQLHSIFHLENTQGEILLENLPAGLHFVSLVVEGRVVSTERLVKM